MRGADDAGLQRYVRRPDEARALRDVQQRVRGIGLGRDGHVHQRHVRAWVQRGDVARLQRIVRGPDDDRELRSLRERLPGGDGRNGDGAVHGRRGRRARVHRHVRRDDDGAVRDGVLLADGSEPLRLVLERVPRADERERERDVHGEHAGVRDCVQRQPARLQRGVRIRTPTSRRTRVTRASSPMRTASSCLRRAATAPAAAP